MALKTVPVENTAQAYLELLATMGLRYFIGNAGTDFAPIIDAFSKRAAEEKNLPRPMLIAHECCAVSMAYGYYLTSGLPTVVMVHSTPGTANALGALMNASRANIPIVLTAGRTPITEKGKIGCRDTLIHWGQEAFDQGSLVREFVKWDFELKTFDHLETVVRRAFTMAMTEPRGPVYLTLPREVLAEPHAEFTLSDRGWDSPVSRLAPDPASLEKLAAMVADAANPLIITRNLGRNPEAVAALVALAESFALPVVEYDRPGCVNFPASHPMHLGYHPGTLLNAADLVMVVECDVPWFPVRESVNPEAKVVHIGVDPLQSRYPMWGFPVDLAIASDVGLALVMLTEALAPARKSRAVAIQQRAAKIVALHREQRAAWKQEVERLGRQEALTFEWVSHCLGQVKDEKTVFINEYDLDLRYAALEEPGSMGGISSAGYLGWGVGSALGAKLGAPEKTVIAAVGDGSYLFSGPSACHMASAAHNLPILTVIFNNGGWAAMDWSTRLVHPQGWAARTKHFDFVRFQVDPAYEKIVEAFGGVGFAVSSPREFPDVLGRALKLVRDEGRQVVINAKCVQL